MPPPWRFDWTGRIYLIKDKYVLIEEQLTEAFNEAMGQYHILTLARYVDTNEPLMLKIGYEIDPSTLSLPPFFQRISRVTTSWMRSN
ncbi:hypothetical protein MW887_007990 [Aspergillus wentii]|nr:hypothetical protein MW887_007990 [Aspergillus wentii]